MVKIHFYTENISGKHYIPSTSSTSSRSLAFVKCHLFYFSKGIQSICRSYNTFSYTKMNKLTGCKWFFKNITIPALNDESILSAKPKHEANNDSGTQPARRFG